MLFRQAKTVFCVNYRK